MLRLTWVVGLFALLVVSPARAQLCAGDCNSDYAVDIAELVRGVGIALGNTPVEVCPAFDSGGDGRVVINELIISLSEKLNITSVAVTHDMNSARKIADRMVLLYDGNVIADAPTKFFLESKDDRVQRFIHGRADEEDLKAIHAGIEGQ